MEQEHKRRVRYKGTHPVRFQDKYKELQPEKYGDTIAHVIGKGSTPAGMHLSIMVDEILQFLQIKPGQQGLDATLGYGGHTLEMMKQMDHQGHMYATDIDPIESEKTRKRLEEKGFGSDFLTIRQMNFADLDQLAAEAGPFDFVLADLGVSSMQIDNPERGFSYKTEGPLDLRLNPLEGISAAERLRDISREELAGMLTENADEPYAWEIAEEIVKRNRKGDYVETTSQLRELIQKVVEGGKNPGDKEPQEAVKKSCQRTFQALRIDVNQEFEVLYSFLDKLPGVLKPGGRVAVLTFHSGEDKLVKKIFRDYERQGIFSQVAKEVIRPSEEECARNARARSTKMRWAVK